MEAVTFLDTHVLLWLAAGSTELFSPAASAAITAAERRLVSPMVYLELHYLQEIGRLGIAPAQVLRTAGLHAGVQLADGSLREIVAHSNGLQWTRDPFDRLIVGQAMAASAPLISKDSAIRAHYARAIW